MEDPFVALSVCENILLELEAAEVGTRQAYTFSGRTQINRVLRNKFE